MSRNLLISSITVLMAMNATQMDCERFFLNLVQTLTLCVYMKLLNNQIMYSPKMEHLSQWLTGVFQIAKILYGHSLPKCQYCLAVYLVPIYYWLLQLRFVIFITLPIAQLEELETVEIVQIITILENWWWTIRC